MLIRRALVLVLIAALPVLAPARTLRYASQDDPQTLDPHSANLLATSRLLGNVYEPLVWRDRDWKVIPWLAVSWTQPDERTWRFRLREGVKFHDGSVLTADDVVFSVERGLTPTSQMRVALQGVERAVKVDGLTVELRLKEPNPALLAHLTNFRIMSRAWAVKNGAQKPQDYTAKEDTFAARNANGTGAFRVKERQTDVRTVLVAHDGWWGRQAGQWDSNLTEVVMLPVKSNATRLAALLSGEVDFVIDPPTQDVARLKASPGIKVQPGGEMRVQYIAFDVFRDELVYGSEKTKNPFKDLRVRRAVAHAIDAEAIRAKVMRGFSKPAGSVLSPGIAGYDPSFDARTPYDRDRAKRLLAEAGYPNGFEVTLDVGNVQPAADIAQAVASMLAQVGIRVKTNIVPQSNYFPKIERFDTSFYVLSWGGGVTSDSLYTLRALLHTPDRKTGAGDFNMGRWSNAEVDAIVARLQREADPAKRTALTGEALKVAARELPLVPIHQPLIPWAMRKGVTAWHSPVNTLYFFRARLDP
ncbi:MAG TPA: ABC transporter substrate-binding protein [Usitatibacteraceae bacterium]|nr:ABC transporter substrate-binding protein [Usitatibacteraceae bacterium]